MQLDNLSSWAATLTPGWGEDRQMQMTCIVKMGFKWDEQGQISELDEQDCPLVLSDEYYDDDPEARSLKRAADTVPFKQGFEWLLNGSVSANGVIHQPLCVTFRGCIAQEKTIYATGPRVWTKTLFGVVPEKPTSVQTMPIQYELAFGGCFTAENDKVTLYETNPVGQGYYPVANKCGEFSLPCFEYEPFIKSPKDTPKPAGFGPISLTWQPRLEQFKAMDADAAAQGQCPYPKSVAEDLYNSAPQDQRVSVTPQGAFVFSLTGFNSRSETIHVPALKERIRLVLKRDYEISNLTLQCDTLHIDTDAKIFSLVWRCAVPWNPLAEETLQLLLVDRDSENAADGEA